MTTNTGGSAFPMAFRWDAPYEQCNGMTLRDYFAAKAVQSDIIDYMYEHSNTGSPHVIGMKQIRTREEAKYAYADAMLKARG
jgi:hypothetical protein